MKYFEKGVNFVGIGPKPDSDLQKAVLYAFESDDGKELIVRHKPYLTPEFLIELGHKLIEMGKRLQQ